MFRYSAETSNVLPRRRFQPPTNCRIRGNDPSEKRVRYRNLRFGRNGARRRVRWGSVLEPNSGKHLPQFIIAFSVEFKLIYEIVIQREVRQSKYPSAAVF